MRTAFKWFDFYSHGVCGRRDRSDRSVHSVCQCECAAVAVQSLVYVPRVHFHIDSNFIRLRLEGCEVWRLKTKIGISIFAIFRSVSKRTYKTLLRSCLKQKPIDNTKPLRRHIDKNDRDRLVRSSSTPSLKRCWLCQSCELLNDSVTWHCLNCECVSFIAPIYKDTIHRSNTKSSITSVVCTVGAEHSAATRDTASKQLADMEDTPMSNGPRTKCPQCIFRQTDSQLCYHQLQSRLHQCPASSRGDDCYVRQPKYNIVTRYRAIDGRYNFHREKTNRSLSSIVDAFRVNAEPASDDAFFGERIFTINYKRPNADPVTRNPDITRFTHFAAKSAVGENAMQQRTSTGNSGQSVEPMSRFTVTTLSRDASANKNLTLPRNGGVFVAVRDWSTTSTPAPATAQADTGNDNYYEILKNPNNNVVMHTYENSGQPQPKAGGDESSGTPIYAVVNKANKMKNRQPIAADSTKFTYIGMTPAMANANAKPSESFYATIRRASPNTSSIANAINNNGNEIAGPTNNNGNSKRFSCSDVDAKDTATHVSITSSADKPHSETSQIYAKVWKGPKKPMDSQKMYALNANPLTSRSNPMDINEFLLFLFQFRRMNRTASGSESVPPPRMWTCTKCSYAYNPLWAEVCDICALRRPPASLTQPSLITVTKDDATAKAAAKVDEKPTVTINRDEKSVKFSKSKSGQSFDEIAAIVEVPMASFEQDLDDDVMFVSDTDAVDAPTPEWTCKKCTLVNSIQNKVCVVCGGSKLKSISAVEDMTLRKGEFWTCAQCTLKNSLSTNVCIACKSAKQTLVISGQQTNYRPYTSSPANNNNKQSAGVVHRQQPQPVASNSNQSLAPPIHRVLRSPSPKYERNASGAIPKVRTQVALPLDVLHSFQTHFSRFPHRDTAQVASFWANRRT